MPAPNDTGQTYRTKRLTLRPLTSTDAAQISHLAGDLDVARMTARIPHPYSEQQARQWIGESDAGEFVRGIAVRSELIGCCGYLPIEEDAAPQHDDPIAEIGYWLGKPFWGQGFATEAATALIDVCHQHGFKTILAGHFHDNPASGAILKKLGFQQTGQEHRWGEARNKLDLAVRYILRTK